MDDTIVAAASAPGTGALAVVRLSGTRAHRIVEQVLGGGLGPERKAVRRTVRDGTSARIDDGIVIRYDAPRSYTGEDCIEIVCHGGRVTPARVVAALVEAGARPAEPGEFTRRAVLNGKMDILQAEAVNDLIRAESSAGATLALDQLDGGLSRRLEALRERILDLEALIAYEIDFPEEDDGPVDAERIETATREAIETVQQLLATAPRGELIRQGALVVIAGAPNAGKSSLFNAVLGRRRALVTDVPGTTRDALEAVVDTQPVPLRLVDTAGLRQTTDVVEQLGVSVAREYLERAHAVLACGESVDALRETIETVRSLTENPIIEVRTKADLHPDRRPDSTGGPFWVSATTGEGVEAVIRAVSQAVADRYEGGEDETPIVTHARYRRVLQDAQRELREFQSVRTASTVPATISGVHLREAVRTLETLIGAVDVEDVLERVFGSFCVGK